MSVPFVLCVLGGVLCGLAVAASIQPPRLQRVVRANGTLFLPGAAPLLTVALLRSHAPVVCNVLGALVAASLACFIYGRHRSPK